MFGLVHSTALTHMVIGWFKRKVERKMTAQIVGAVIRAGLQMAGGASLASDNEVEQIAGGIAIVVTVAWSIYQKYAANKAKK